MVDVMGNCGVDCVFCYIVMDVEVVVVVGFFS